MPNNAADLERIQRWFHASVTHPLGIQCGLASDPANRLLPEAGRRLENVILPSNTLSATERLSIYANMYFERLVEILAEEFPSVRHLLGPQTFDAVVKCYVTHHPSTHYSLARLGHQFPQFLLDKQDELDVPHREFASAVATVERSMEDVFDAEQVEPLVFDQIQAIPAENWDRIQMKMIPALRLLALPFPVNDYVNAVRDRLAVTIPAASRSYVVVYRLEFRVWRSELDEQQFTLLCELNNGQTLGQAVATCAELPGGDPEALAADLHKWFRNWAAEGFFHKVEAA